MSDGGKGSDRRPGKGYESGWDRIFGKKLFTIKEPAQQPEKKMHECCNGNCNQGRNCPRPIDWSAA